MVQKELEVRRQLVEYDQPVGMGGVQYPNLGEGGGGNEFRRGKDRHGNGGNRHREGRKRYRDEDAPPADGVKRQDRELKVEKNPRFREKGDSDEEDGGDGGKS